MWVLKANELFKKIKKFFRFISTGKIGTVFYLKGSNEKSTVWGGVITFLWLTLVLAYAIRIFSSIFNLESFNLSTSS